MAKREEIETYILVIHNNLYHAIHGTAGEFKEVFLSIAEQQKKRILEEYDLNTVLSIAREILSGKEYEEFRSFMTK